MMRVARIIGRHKDMLAVAIIIAAVALALMAPSLTNASKADGSKIKDKSGSLQTTETPSNAVTAGIAPNQQKHVLFIGIDGLRNADLQDPLLINSTDTPNIVALQKAGVTYTNNFIPVPNGTYLSCSPKLFS